jgi:hypothetical protein
MKQFFDTKLLQTNAPFPEIELGSFVRAENQYGANGAIVKMALFPSLLIPKEI